MTDDRWAGLRADLDANPDDALMGGYAGILRKLLAAADEAERLRALVRRARQFAHILDPTQTAVVYSTEAQLAASAWLDDARAALAEEPPR